jgi:hypothetical protein
MVLGGATRSSNMIVLTQFGFRLVPTQ